MPWERHDAYRRQFALLLGQKNQLWWDLPARKSLELNAKIYGIPDEVRDRTVAEMTELLAVRDKINVAVRELSLGERMKMELIAYLLHRPRVLFLDEPTIGLDVVSQKIVREFLREHNAREISRCKAESGSQWQLRSNKAASNASCVTRRPGSASRPTGNG